MDLKGRSLRSGAVTLISQGLLFLMHIGSTMILARLLTPQDYGIISMVAAITGFARIFSDLGLSTATIQCDEINHEQVSTLFWINVGLGTLIAVIVAAISPAVAWFYKTPQLVWVTMALSLNFLITGLAVQHQALLTRQMQFYTIAKVRIFSTLIGIAVAISMAIHGYRYWALVFNTITASASSVVCFWLISKWRPGLPHRNSRVRPMLRFGSDISGFNIINYFARNLDNILIGRYCGSGALGFYSKAYQLLMMPITNLRSPMDKVAMPSLSRLQNEPVRYRNYYMKYLSILSFVSMPLVVFMFVCSDSIINIVLGPQWMEASEIFKILAFVALIQPVGSSRGLVLLSTGNSRRYLILGAATAFLISISFFMGIPWGAKGVAMAYAIAVYLVLFPFLFLSFQNTPVGVHHFLNAIKKPFVASLVMGVICYILVSNMKDMNNIVSLISCFVASLFTYLGSIVILSGGLKDLREYHEYLKLILSKNK